jgi:serine/threonine protein kinase
MIAPDTLLQNRYLVQKQIGQGGMGAVYVATDQRFGSTVALKETFFDDPNMRKAFEREARLLNHLRHPALPRVSDHFTEEDGQYLVMEFIPGADLAEMLKEKGAPFPLSEVLDWADQLLDALDYLHTHEPPVIHRDIKPQNLKLTARGHIVLLDFGLAKGTPLQASRVTATGSVFGYSFNYAPLEQMQGTGTDPRSDLYSLAATVYHLVTNVAPPDALTRATAVLNGEADPLRPAHEVQALVSAPVARVLMKAMAQSAAQRPQTAAEMREALREAAHQTSAAALPPVVQPLAGVSAVEQHTQWAGARATEPVAGHQLAGAVKVAHDDKTLVETALPAGSPQPLRARSRERESVITNVRPSHPPAPQPKLSRRMIGILSSVMLLLAVAVAVYAFTRQPTAQSTSVQTVPSPMDTASPQPSLPATAETQSPALSPGLSAGPTPSQPDSTSPNRAPQSSSDAASPNSQPAAPGNNPAATQQPAQNKPDSTSSSLTPEAERARQADEIRRQRREADQEEMKRKRAELEKERQQELEMQREKELRRTGPPPPSRREFPPPRRDGPPPY